MPDYDPKSIPILDDIIEEDKTEPELTGSDVDDIDDELDTDQVDDNLDLFTATSSDIEDETAGPEIGAIDKFIDSTADASEIHDSEMVESALIGYHQDGIDEPALDIQDEGEQQTDIQVMANAAYEDMAIDDDIEDLPTASIQPVALDSIVDDVVKQILPDLEQQLRFLVLQALEEKLPAEIIEQTSTDNDD